MVQGCPAGVAGPGVPRGVPAPLLSWEVLEVVEVGATVAEIDEALRHASLVSPRYRGPAWARFVDHLLDARLVVALRGP